MDMPNDNLGAGSDMSAIFAANPEGTEGMPEFDLGDRSPLEDQEPTPAPEGEGEEAPTDGGEPPKKEDEADPELPAALKPDEKPEGEVPVEGEGPELKVSPEFQEYLDKHPELKAHTERELLRIEKGVSKWVSTTGQELKTLRTEAEAEQPLRDMAAAFRNGETRGAVIADLIEVAERAGMPAEFVSESGRRYTITPEGEGLPAAAPTGEPASTSKFGLEFSSDDKVVETAVAQSQKLIAPLEAKIDRILEKFSTQEQRESVQSKVATETPALQREYGDWVTAEMVGQALAAHPALTPSEAFGAKFSREIARNMHALGARTLGGNGKPRNMASPGASGQPGTRLPAGSDFWAITQAEDTQT